MSNDAVFVGDRKVMLARRVGKGGEGEVYSLEGDPAHAVKLYTVSDIKSRESKVDTMIRAALAQQAPQVAFPLAIVRTAQGQFAGFLMKLVANHKPLHELYSPGSRKNHFPQADYRFLVRTAANISRAVAAVHKLGCVIGDINHSSILISRDATVALIDSDSFQIEGDSQLYLCRVGVPEYTPPELQGLPLGNISRTANHDAFGLAVVIFQMLLMGRHPFVGATRRGEPPPLPECIRQFQFVYTEGRNVGMDQPPGTPALSEFPKAIGDSFETAFGRNTKDQRPSAITWAANLTLLENSLIQCTEDKLHWYPKEADDCPWCVMERTVGGMLFVPHIPPAQTSIAAFDPGAQGFKLAAVWSYIEGLPTIDRQKLTPTFPAENAQPSAEVRAAVTKKKLMISVRVASALAAILVAVSVPALWMLWVPLGLYALFSKTGFSFTAIGAQLNRQYAETDSRWQGAMQAWYKRVGVEDYEQQLKLLRDAKQQYENLKSEENAKKDHYTRERRARQLHAFLDGFEIRRAKVKGIGPAKQAALASYGIETATDVELDRVLRVPGFGETTSGTLVQWRAKVEGQFVYNQKANEIDRQEINRISTQILAKASTLRRTLLAGRANLEALSARARAMLSTKDPELMRLHAVRSQILVDLECIGGTITLSAVQRTSSAQQVVPVATLQQSVMQSSQPAQKSAQCPRCGSNMVQRVAQRGRWSGQHFWGCTRYPICKGSRSI